MWRYISSCRTKFSEEGFVALLTAVWATIRLVGAVRFRRYWHWLRCPDAMSHPYDLVYIDPADVQHVATNGLIRSPRLRKDRTYIIGGEWDRPDPDAEVKYLGDMESQFDEYGTVPIANCLFYQSVENHVRHGRPWSETEFYRWVTTTDDISNEYTSRAGRRWRFDQLDQLAESMRENGYLSQRECEGTVDISSGHEVIIESDNGYWWGFDPDDAPQDDESVVTSPDRYKWGFYPEDVPPECKEVTVDIGRDGALIFVEGRHRFSVARALGVDRMPVRVFARHARWQKRREEVARATSPADVSDETRQYLSHPDMADVATFQTEGQCPQAGGADTSDATAGSSRLPPNR